MSETGPDDRNLESEFDRYAAGGQREHAGDIAVQLVQLRAEQLHTNPELRDEARIALFEETWGLLMYAIDAVPVIDKPLVWAERQQLAAALLAERPGFTRSYNARTAIAHLDSAFNIYRQRGEHASLSACARQVIVELTHLTAWAPEIRDRFLFYLEKAEGADVTDDLQRADDQQFLAARCAEVLGAAGGDPKIAERMRDLAAAAYVVHERAADHAACAIDQILVGNAHVNRRLAGPATLTTSNPPRDEARYGRLQLASHAFELAKSHAAIAHTPAKYAQACRLWSQALAEIFLGAMDDTAYTTPMRALNEAADASEDADKALCYVNALSVIFEALKRGQDVAVDDARHALAALPQYVDFLPTSALSQTRAVAEGVQAWVTNGPGVLEEIDPRLKWLKDPSLIGSDREAATTKLMLEALAGLVAGILGPYEDELRQTLDPYGALVVLSKVAVPEETVAYVRSAIEVDHHGPLWDVPDDDLTELVNHLIETARNKGVDAAIEDLRTGLERRGDLDTEIEAARAVASDRQRRRAFLEVFLRDRPDYSPERESELMRVLNLSMELELQQLEVAGAPTKDPDAYAVAVQDLQGAHKWTDRFMADDRRDNGSGPAKQLLSRAIRDEATFVLLLRAFSEETPSSEVPSPMARLIPRVDDPRVRWQVTTQGASNTSVIERVAETVAKIAPPLMIANAVDVFPPRTPLKLFVNQLEWRKVAFALIGEAPAIVLILPKSAAQAGGVFEELAMIRVLQREPNVAVIISGPRDSLLDGLLAAEAPPTADAPETDTAALLARLGWPHVFDEKTFTERPQELVDVVRHALQA